MSMWFSQEIFSNLDKHNIYLFINFCFIKLRSLVSLPTVKINIILNTYIILFLDSKRNEKCISFTLMCVFSFYL